MYKKVINNKAENIVYKGLLFYGIVILLDPTNSIIHIKIPAFILCMVIWFLFSHDKINKKSVGIVLISWIFLLYGNIISCFEINNIDIEYKSQINNLGLLIFILFPLCSISFSKKIKLIKILGLILSISIIAIYLIFLVSGFGDLLYLYFTEKANMTIMIAKRETLGISMTMFFHKASPFLFLPLAISLVNLKCLKNILLCIIYMIPIIIGGSRTPMLCALCMLMFSLLCKIKSKFFKSFIILFTLIVFGVLLFNIVIEAQSAEEMKFGAFDSYISTITSEPSNMFFGQGIGGKVAIPERGMMAYSELSIMDLYNQYGIIIGSFYLFFLIYPAINLFLSCQMLIKNLALGYIFYIIVSATNPLLFSSTGWFVLCIIYSIYINYNKKNSIRNKHNKNDFSLYRYV